MSAEDTVSDAAGAISADRFVEISYDEVIPNNVALGSDKQLQRALEGWRPNGIVRPSTLGASRIPHR